LVGADMQDEMDANSIGRTTERQHYHPNGGLALITMAPRRTPRPVLGEATASDKANRKSTFSPVSIYGLTPQHSRRPAFFCSAPYILTQTPWAVSTCSERIYRRLSKLRSCTPENRSLLSVILVECLNLVVQLIRQYGR